MFQTSKVREVTWKCNRKSHLPILFISNYFWGINVYESKFKMCETSACKPCILYLSFYTYCPLFLAVVQFFWGVVYDMHMHAHTSIYFFLQIIVNCFIFCDKCGGVGLQSPHSKGWGRRMITHSRSSCAT